MQKEHTFKLLQLLELAIMRSDTSAVTDICKCITQLYGKGNDQKEQEKKRDFTDDELVEVLKTQIKEEGDRARKAFLDEIAKE